MSSTDCSNCPKNLEVEAKLKEWRRNWLYWQRSTMRAVGEQQEEMSISYMALENELSALKNELRDKEKRYRFYEWFFELTNTETRETLEKMYGEELPDGINSI